MTSLSLSQQVKESFRPGRARWPRCALSLGAREHEGFLWWADQNPLYWREFRVARAGS